MKKIIIVALLLLPCYLIYGQGIGAWSDFSMNFKFSEKVNFKIENEIRLRNGFSELDRLTLGISFNYNLLPKEVKAHKLDADLGYKYLVVGEYSEIMNSNCIFSKHRGHIGLIYKARIGNLSLSLRERYQVTCNKEIIRNRIDITQVAGGVIIDGRYVTAVPQKDKHVLRSRFQIDYSIPNSGLSPFVSVEPMNNLKDSFRIDKIRCMAGAKYSFSWGHSIQLGYVCDAYVGNRPCNQAVSLSYSVGF